MSLALESFTQKNMGPYLYVPEGELRLISVFDDLKYDRADADYMSPAMRMYLVKKLQSIGFVQSSGNVLEHKADDIKCIIPKGHALGASPFYAADFTHRRAQDYFALTPTQTACQLIANYETEEAVARVKELICVHPVNILRISDYLEYCEDYHDFKPAIGHLLYVQRQAIETAALKKLRPLSVWQK